MNAKLELFLGRHTPLVSESVTWGERMRLRATAYLSPERPPPRYVTSVRAIVLRGESVLVQQDRDSRHILPGGRREGDESIEATLRREVAEETGWLVGNVALLGFIHFLHLDPIQPGYAYPHPDFLQIVHVAEAACIRPGPGWTMATRSVRNSFCSPMFVASRRRRSSGFTWTPHCEPADRRNDLIHPRRPCLGTDPFRHSDRIDLAPQRAVPPGANRFHRIGRNPATCGR